MNDNIIFNLIVNESLYKMLLKKANKKGVTINVYTKSFILHLIKKFIKENLVYKEEDKNKIILYFNEKENYIFNSFIDRYNIKNKSEFFNKVIDYFITIEDIKKPIERKEMENTKYIDQVVKTELVEVNMNDIYKIKEELKGRLINE